MDCIGVVFFRFSCLGSVLCLARINLVQGRRQFVVYQSVLQYRAPDKVFIFISLMPISLPNPMFDHLLESSHRDDSNKRSNVGFCEEITEVNSIEVKFRHGALDLRRFLKYFHLITDKKPS